MNATIHRLLTAPGHLVAVERHQCRFGDTWRPVCIEDDLRVGMGCNYVGPFVSRERAHAIAEEHRRKSAETWRAAW